jgi:hypothetical protein
MIACDRSDDRLRRHDADATSCRGSSSRTAASAAKCCRSCVRGWQSGSLRGTGLALLLPRRAIHRLLRVCTPLGDGAQPRSGGRTSRAPRRRSGLGARQHAVAALPDEDKHERLVVEQRRGRLARADRKLGQVGEERLNRLCKAA